MTSMIYGAYGYTGTLAVELAVEAGDKPILAGRSADRLKPLADKYGLEARAFSLDDNASAKQALNDVAAVFNAAGPYSSTAAAMTSLCMQTNTHYVDVTAESDVILAMQAQDKAAKEAGVMILPVMGAGGGPPDCAAAKLKQLLPDATELEFFGGSLQSVSRGTAKSAMETIHVETKVRRNGALVSLKKPLFKTININGNPRESVTMPLCEPIICYWSTKIPNITTYVENAGAVKQMSSIPGFVKKLLGTRIGQKFMLKQIEKNPVGPSEEERAAGVYANVGVVRNAAGDEVSIMAHGPEGYTITALSALEALRRASGGSFIQGYQTASTAYGPEFFESIPGCRFEQL